MAKKGLSLPILKLQIRLNRRRMNELHIHIHIHKYNILIFEVSIFCSLFSVLTIAYYLY